MSGLYHDNLTSLTVNLNRLLATANVPETFDIRWPSSACTIDIEEGLKSRVVKNLRPAALRIPLGDADVASNLTQSIQEFALNKVDGYWSARVNATDRPVGEGCIEYKPMMSHLVAGSREEGYADREIKRITLFRTVDERAGIIYLCECFVKALDWRGGVDCASPTNRREEATLSAKKLADQTKLSQRFVSIMVGDLWTFPECCVRELERWVIDLNVGQQHFDVPHHLIQHTRSGKCPCKKLQAMPGSRSYLIFNSDRVITHIIRVLKFISGGGTSATQSASRGRPSRLNVNY